MVARHGGSAEALAHAFLPDNHRPFLGPHFREISPCVVPVAGRAEELGPISCPKPNGPSQAKQGNHAPACEWKWNEKHESGLKRDNRKKTQPSMLTFGSQLSSPGSLAPGTDRKSVVEGKGVDLGGRR